MSFSHNRGPAPRRPTLSHKLTRYILRTPAWRAAFWVLSIVAAVVYLAAWVHQREFSQIVAGWALGMAVSLTLWRA